MLLSLSFVLAAEPVDIRGWSPERYNDELVEVHSVYLDDLGRRAATVGIDLDGSAYAGWLTYSAERSHLAWEQVAAFPPYRGDESLRATMLELLAVRERHFATTYMELNQLEWKPEVVNADLARAEELMVLATTEEDRADAALEQAQQIFAAKHRFLLDEEAEVIAFDFGPGFTHPDLPPDGSLLSASTHVGFAWRYDEGIIAGENRMIDQVNLYADATWSLPLYEQEEVRQQVVEALAQETARARAMEDWQGDARERDALVAFGLVLEGQLQGPTLELLELSGKLLLFGKKRKRWEALPDLIDAATEEGRAQLDEAIDLFRERWYINTFMAWQDETFGAGISL